MLSQKKRKELCATFTALPSLYRQLIALKIMCWEPFPSHSEHRFTDAILNSGLKNEQGKRLTSTLYHSYLQDIKKLNFSDNTRQFSIHKTLHHDLLVLMPESEMAWVFLMVDTLHKSKSNDFEYQSPLSIRACTIKALYSNDPSYFSETQVNLNACHTLLLYLREIFNGEHIDGPWFDSRHPIIQSFILIALLRAYYCEEDQIVIDNAHLLSLFSKQNPINITHDYLNYYNAIICLSLGKMEKALEYSQQITDLNSGFSLALQATFALLTNQVELTQILYPKALSALKKQLGYRHYYFDNILGIFYSLYLLYIEKKTSQLGENIQRYTKNTENGRTMPMGFSYTLLGLLEKIEQGERESAHTSFTSLTKQIQHPLTPPIAYALYHLIGYILNEKHLETNHKLISLYITECIKNEHILSARLLTELFDKYKGSKEEKPHFQFLSLIKIKEHWEYSFQALENLLLENKNSIKKSDHEKTKRLLWLLDPEKKVIAGIVEQTLNKTKKWNTGKTITLQHLKKNHHTLKFDYLKKEDQRIIDCIISLKNHWPYNEEYEFDPLRTLLALVGHPHIAHYQNRELSIELVLGEAELHIEENIKGYHFSLSHWLPNVGVILEPESLTKYRVIEFSTALHHIAQVLTQKGLSLPEIAKDKVLSMIRHAKQDIKIHVGIKNIDIPEIQADPTPCVQLFPIKDGLKINIWVRPLAHRGAYYKIAEGKELLMDFIEENGIETRMRIVRDLIKEKNNLSDLLTHCPNLPPHEYEPTAYETSTPEESLEVLSELQNYALNHAAVIEWPQGQTFKIKQKVFTQNLSLKISSVNNWFEYEGDITLNDGEVLRMQDILSSLQTDSVGRFLRLSNGEFVELTSKLKKQLSLLQSLSDHNKINPLGAQVLSDIAEEAEHLTFDKGWEAHLNKVHQMKKHSPKVPSTLQASLRDYQVDGFRYLSRLTHWGIGACLADDMGLGKTIQTIALLLERGKNGAALIIAPTSVCFNWIEELTKFAPTLNVYNLRTDERLSIIQNAGVFDVVICSYGLLQHNAELLTDKNWETLVLDEAQAIKNAHTKRWKTVMRLKGKNRIALSGTPIENHLGELWSIFSFINPGLLGSIKAFQHHYSSPIESHQSQEKMQALKTLVTPYILRRMKSDVLSELPPKTEQTIYIEQSKEEFAFYESLRRKAEKNVTLFIKEKNRFGVLVELGKLRQACCDSSLVDSSVALNNSKLAAFIETVKSIIDNGHKALVFSQYVSFLAIVRRHIEAENICYQYLDGSSSPASRKKSVESFQNGEGDLFLLSLKAGGSGLNLTTADYVIHLDPWWNPAVEDQASDRVHRIGQERPVTIYRFVMRHTIEEKIIKLHQHKRNLANDLLSGQGSAGKLSNSDLLNLISNTL